MRDGSSTHRREHSGSHVTKGPQISWPLGHRLAETREKGRGRFRQSAHVWMTALCTLLISGGLVVQAGPTGANTPGTPSRSTTIALTADERRVVVVNREANSVSVIKVRSKDGANDIGVKQAEIPVGLEPRCVAVHPNDQEAYVTNGISGTVSVVSLIRLRVLTTIKVGTEPRGCALTPDGLLLYVANHTEGTVSIVNTTTRAVVGKVTVGRNPTAIAITNTGTGTDTVFVTQIFAKLNPAFRDLKFDGNGEA